MKGARSFALVAATLLVGGCGWFAQSMPHGVVTHRGGPPSPPVIYARHGRYTVLQVRQSFAIATALRPITVSRPIPGVGIIGFGKQPRPGLVALVATRTTPTHGFRRAVGYQTVRRRNVLISYRPPEKRLVQLLLTFMR